MIVSMAIAVLPDLAVADDQFALAFADRDQRVDRADTGLQRLLDRLTLARRRAPCSRSCGTCVVSIGPLPSTGLPSGSTTRPSSASPYGNRDDAARAPDLLAFFDLGIGAEDDDADVVLFEVQRDALQAVGKLDEFRLLGPLRARRCGRCSNRLR